MQQGGPDYVTRELDGLVLVEVKSRGLGPRPRGPYPGERAQLFAYCLIVEEQFGGKILYGELQYRDRRVNLPFGDAERREIIALLAEIEAERDAHRSHEQAARCKACGFRDGCDEALA